MSDAPGTVSKILWHFTGGPTWNAAENRQNKTPKPAAAAYAALQGILETRELRIGQYKEVVKVRVPEVRNYDSRTRTFTTKKNVLTELESASVCCLADIPVVHLSYHASRYGKFAIGFHRECAIRNGFNPVLYTLHDTKIIQSIYQGFGELKYVDADAVRSAASEIEGAAEDNDDVSSAVTDIEMAADDIESAVDEAKESIERVLAFIKTFDSNEFSTIYCEREWRATEALKFDYSDVAMLVIPRRVGKEEYFAKFVANEVKRLKVPRSIPVVPWEDLVES